MPRFATTLALALTVLTAVSTVGGDLAAAPALKPADERVTRILIEKAARTLTLFRDDTVVATYRVALGGDPVGPKRQQGDSRTPEGRCKIDFKNAASVVDLKFVTYFAANSRTNFKSKTKLVSLAC